MAENAFDNSHAESIGETINGAGDAVQHAYETARDYVREGRGRAGEIVKWVANFVQRDPWLAVGSAFILGYAAAQLIKRMK